MRRKLLVYHPGRWLSFNDGGPYFGFTVIKGNWWLRLYIFGLIVYLKRARSFPITFETHALVERRRKKMGLS